MVNGRWYSTLRAKVYDQLFSLATLNLQRQEVGSQPTMWSATARPGPTSSKSYRPHCLAESALFVHYPSFRLTPTSFGHLQAEPECRIVTAKREATRSILQFVLVGGVTAMHFTQQSVHGEHDLGVPPGHCSHRNRGRCSFCCPCRWPLLERVPPSAVPVMVRPIFLVN